MIEDRESEQGAFLQQRISRRRVLTTSATTAGAIVVAGCTGSDDAVDATSPGTEPPATDAPVVQDPPATTTTPPRETEDGGDAGTDAADLPVDPTTAVDTWQEPWTWRPSEFPGEHLQLNVTEHETPTVLVGFGNPGASIFGYNGNVPGPTVRMRGDETYLLKVINHLGLNGGRAPIGPAPDAAANPPQMIGDPGATVEYKPDWCLGEHSNGVHSARTTNMHTHGLHVRPGLNPADSPGGPQTLSDDIFARLIPIEDLARREEPDSECDIPLDDDGIPLRDNERIGIGTYEFRLGDVQGDPNQPHPPGTHWYHPHAHGSTHNQVSSGLAGFLVIEGDVDEMINSTLAGTAAPDPEVPTGDYGYRERMMFIQRISPFNVSHDPDATSKEQLQKQNVVAVNGLPQALNIQMRPGAVERWRVLNGSVDGKGYLRFMVLRGQWVHDVPPNPPKKPRTVEEFIATKKQLLRVDADGTRHVPTTEEIEAAKVQLHQLSADGITLVRDGDNGPEYYLKDLNFDAPPNPLKQDFTNLADCYRDAESLRACYDRPNEMYMSPAQRADFMFQAPQPEVPGEAEAFTVVAKATAIHTGNEQRALQLAAANLEYAKAKADEQGVDVDSIIKELKISVSLPADTIMAYVVVREDADADPIPPFDLAELSAELSANVPVPQYLQPIQPPELELTPQELADRSLPAGETLYRTRRGSYSGWGAATWPALRTEDLRKFDPAGPEPGPINAVYLAESEVPEIGEVVLPPIYRTMAIDGRKFNPNDPLRPRMGLDTAEEWAPFNNSISLFGDFATPLDDQIDFRGESDEDKKNRAAQITARGYLINHTVGHAVTRREADERGWKITTRGIDHPFHIHTNPMWVLRVDVPDQDGNLVNVLPEPQWHDVMWLPRNAGRVVFRSRFPDYTGTFVNHCHILLHEDNGMMQEVEIVADVATANYTPSPGVGEMTPVDDVYPPESLDDAYRQCTRFIDNNPNPGRAQEYPAINGVFDPPPPG